MAKEKRENSAPRTNQRPTDTSLRTQVDDAVRGVKYGHVTLFIKDGRIVQIDRTEKNRFSSIGEE